MSNTNNLVFLKGRLTRDVELKDVGSTQVAVFSLAVNRSFKKRDGTWAEETAFVNCEAWDSGAKTLQSDFKKGDGLAIEGELKQDSWEKDGKKMSQLKVRVNHFGRHVFPAKKVTVTSDSDESGCPLDD